MLASRHHNRCRKFRQSSRATSALNDSSNQKGLQARHTKRITALPAMSNRSVNPRTQPLESRRSGELRASSFAADSRGRMLSVHVESLSSRQFPDDTMLGKNGVYAFQELVHKCFGKGTASSRAVGERQKRGFSRWGPRLFPLSPLMKPALPTTSINFEYDCGYTP